MVSDIRAESCYLTWDAPEDNGGSELTNYIIEKRDASKKKSDWEPVTNCVVDRRYEVCIAMISNRKICIIIGIHENICEYY